MIRCCRLLSLAAAGAVFGFPGILRGEAMLQLFNVSWSELAQKMPEIAEAGYTSLWLAPPAKAGSVFSVGYDLFDPFDLGDKNQRGTIATRYGTKAELLQAVQMAHRFGLRVYFDNITNHRGFDVPGFNATTPVSLYPGMLPADFHLQTVGSYFQNWPGISDWNSVWQVQNLSLSGLLDIANEPGSLNLNFGPTQGSTVAKPVFIRQPANPEYYMATNLQAIAGPWRPFNGTNGTPVPEDVNAYEIRAGLWLLNETKCDGFRFDAAKHVPSAFFGATSATPDGYTGAIQTMFDYVHGYGNNAAGNGYVEPDDNRNSCLDTEAPRNDAMLFGEHLGEPPSFQEYLDRGMRLLNAPYHFQLNNILGNPSASLAGLDQRDYRPFPDAFTGAQSVLFSQSHDDATATHRELQNAYNFLREGLPEIYSDGYNFSSAPAGQDPFPRIANAPYLGQFGDNKMPDLAYLHHQLARGGTRPRWSDNDLVAFERYDYRDVDPATAYANPDATVALFAMNDNTASDISFDDGAAQSTPGTFYECFPVDVSRGVGLVTGFPPGSVLVQLADAPNRGSACTKLLVRQATPNLSEAQASANDPDPVKRKVYVGSQTLAPGGGAVEFKVPKGSYVIYGYQWPEPSRAGLGDAITLRQGGADAPRLTVVRHDGVNGDPGFNPLYSFKMRGSVDAAGNIVVGSNVSNRAYAIDVPVVTNGIFDVLLRCDASAANLLAKLDGGLDLNRQMGLGSTNVPDARDNRPGYATDVFLGYEQAASQFRYGPEKFAARDVARDNVTAQGAETYGYTVAGTNFVINGAGNGTGISTRTAAWVYHDPVAGVTVQTNSTLMVAPPTQRVPLNPAPGQAVDLWVKVGYRLQINRCSIYYTTDGSDPQGAFGIGKGTTKVVAAGWVNADSADSTIDWWKGAIPGSEHAAGTQIRYRIAVFHDAVPPISDADGAKVFGLTQFAITNFNPTTATVWLHNDLNPANTTTGLQSGFHILRARAFLPRSGKSGVFNTFLQTFYYDAALPGGAIAYPPADGASLTSGSYGVVVRADASVTGVDFNIQDSDPNNDDARTGQPNGNGLSNGVPSLAAAALVTPDPNISRQFPSFPQEFRFNYAAIPSNGTATITVRLKTLSTTAIPNRFTTLTRSVKTAAPPQTLRITNPAGDGALLILRTNDLLPLQACFTATLTTNSIDPFSFYINGVFQPRYDAHGAALYRISPAGCAAGMQALNYDWTGSRPGTNMIQLLYSGPVVLSDTRVVAVARPGDSDGDGMPDWAELIAGTDPYDSNSVLRITQLTDGNQLLVWSSVPGIRYQVLATPDLNTPMAPLSAIIPASGTSTFFFDNSPSPSNKLYRIRVVP